MADHGIGSGLKRGDVERRTGCNLETIRYYEKIGLLLEPARNANSYRIYDDTHVRRLRFILRGRELGFSIEDIKRIKSNNIGNKSIPFCVGEYKFCFLLVGSFDLVIICKFSSLTSRSAKRLVDIFSFEFKKS